MKTLRMLSVMALAVSGWMTSFAQEAEVPGDHFSLEGALELFKKSSSPEEFERMLNSPDSKVNNLDLNGDGYIDYVRVHDRYEGNIHAFIIQAVISEDQLQDIAVIELEKLSNGKAVLQIIGDEDIYGVTTIIEPTQEVRTYAGTQTTRTVVNVWAWPSVQYVYGPYYTSWISPWGWHHHPVWYSRWRPIAYVYYYPVWRPYHHHYVVCHTRRIVHAYDIYHPYRRTSVIVHHRHHDRVTRYRETYRDGRTRDDGRQYARDDRSGNRNDVRRGRDNSNRTRSSAERESDSYPSRPGTRERSTTTGRQGNINQVRTDSPLRRAEPDQQPVRKDRVTSYSPGNRQEAPTTETRSRTTSAPELQRSRTSQPTIRTQTTRNPNETRSTMSQRPAAVQSNPQIERRTQVERSSQIERRPQVERTHQVERSHQVERVPQVQRSREVQPNREVQRQSHPAAVERRSPPSQSTPQRSSERPDRTRGRQ